ncbi:MAG TPA: hypothetical protein VFB12_33230, partial [Ktedonobacteraceae bacterium]|nr:hypothetical protein [Ktedonobacteraceae bacterium]
MLIDSTITLCLGNFLRQKLKAALESYDVVASKLPYEFLASAKYSTKVPEVAVLQNLVAFYDPGTGAHAQRLVQLA